MVTAESIDAEATSLISFPFPENFLKDASAWLNRCKSYKERVILRIARQQFCIRYAHYGCDGVHVVLRSTKSVGSQF